MNRFFLFLILIFSVSLSYAVSTKNSSHKKALAINIPVNWSYSTIGQGLTLQSQNGVFQTNLHSYIQGDAIKFGSNSQGLHSGTNMRRVRLDLTGTVLTNWNYAVGYDLAGKYLTDASLSYNILKNMSVKLGQFLPDVSLSNWTDNTALSFLELALPVNAFVPDFSQGAEYDVANNQFAFIASGYTAGTEQSYSGRAPINASVRAFYSPVHLENFALHFGAWGWYNRPDGTNTVSFSTVPEAMNHSQSTLINTGTIYDVRNDNAVGIESAGVFGPWSVQGEGIVTHVGRQAGKSTLMFSGYYLMGSYFLTGESRNYSFPAGAFVSVTDIHSKKYGAWEVLAQFSNLNLNDADVRGGAEHDATLGLNWYVNPFVEFRFDYIRAMASKTSYATANRQQNVNIFGARMQVQF